MRDDQRIAWQGAATCILAMIGNLTEALVWSA